MPKSSDGRVEMIRALRAARRSAVKARRLTPATGSRSHGPGRPAGPPALPLDQEARRGGVPLPSTGTQPETPWAATKIAQLRVHTCQTSQILGIDLICFALVGVDEPQFTRIGHQDLVIDRYAQRPLLRGEAAPEGFGGRLRSLPSSIISPLSWSRRQR